MNDKVYNESEAFEVYWDEHQKCPKHSLTTKNCANATWHARVAIQLAVHVYQYRMRPTWAAIETGWSTWEDCSKESYENYIRLGEYNDWQYEVRALGIITPATPVQAAPDAVTVGDRVKCHNSGVMATNNGIEGDIVRIFSDGLLASVRENSGRQTTIPTHYLKLLSRAHASAVQAAPDHYKDSDSSDVWQECARQTRALMQPAIDSLATLDAARLIACSACYGTGYGVDSKACPCGCRIPSVQTMLGDLINSGKDSSAKRSNVKLKPKIKASELPPLPKGSNMVYDDEEVLAYGQECIKFYKESNRD